MSVGGFFRTLGSLIGLLFFCAWLALGFMCPSNGGVGRYNPYYEDWDAEHLDIPPDSLLDREPLEDSVWVTASLYHLSSGLYEYAVSHRTNWDTTGVTELLAKRPHRYHLKTCQRVSRFGLVVIDKWKAKTLGFTPCQVCNP